MYRECVGKNIEGNILKYMSKVRKTVTKDSENIQNYEYTYSEKIGVSEDWYYIRKYNRFDR